MSATTSAPAEPADHAYIDAPAPAIPIAERRTDELVVALVGAIGSGSSTTAKILVELLEREYGYTHHYIRVSGIIREMSISIGETVPDDDSPPDLKTSSLQALGNILREKFSNKYLAEKCIERIAVDRLEPPPDISRGYEAIGADPSTTSLLPINRRRVHIIDSLKHTEEIEILREVYADTFWLLGVFAPETIREERLIRKGHAAANLKQIFQDDEEDGLENGQKVRDTMHQADFFVRNDALNEDRLRAALSRYLKIIFNVGVNTPTLDEIAMYNAASQASTSACLSRQVGAAIFSHADELIGVGANDVPKFRGGLYCSEDGEHDHRCFKLTGGICFNDDHKSRLYSAIVRELRKDEVLDPAVSVDQVIAALKRTDIRNLIEYSRAVHAEMEAIISVARGNKPGLVGATMYCTTFPCHSCARHIVASGIKRVMYIEPYAKSLAISLHGDAVSMKDSDGDRRVAFLQYEGIAPKNMIRLFKHGIERKRDGRMIKVDPRYAAPIFPSPLDGFAFREQLVVDNVLKNEQNRKQGPNEEGAKPHGGSTKDSGTVQLSLVDPNRPAGQEQ
jgi:deoxycytidylate deaminase